MVHRTLICSTLILAAPVALLNVAQADPVSPNPIADLQSRDISTRIDAARKLATQEAVPPEAIPALIDALDDASWDVRVKASDALAKAGNEALKPLMTAIQQDNYYTPIYAARAIGQMGGVAGQPDVARCLIRNAQMPGCDTAQQESAAWALSKIKCTDSVILDDLKKAYDAPLSPGIRGHLTMAIGYLGEAARPLAEDVVAHLDEISNVPEAIAPFGKHAVGPLLHALETADNNKTWQIYEILGGLGPDAADAVPVLVKELNTPRDEWFGALAARVLGEIGVFTKDAVLALEQARQSSNQGIAKAAKDALAKLPPYL